MRRLLPLILLTTLTTAYADVFAAGNYCFDMPGEDRSLLPRFQGNPKKVAEVWQTLSDGGNPLISSRTYSLQGGRVTQVEASSPGDDTYTLLKLRPDQSGGTYQRSSVEFIGMLKGWKASLASALKVKPDPVTLSFDPQGRLMSYSGMWEEHTTLLAYPEKVSCTYSDTRRQVTQRIIRSDRFSFITTVQLDEQGRVIRTDTRITELGQPGTVLEPSERITRYTYLPDGSGIRMEGEMNGRPLPAMLMTTDAAGRVTHIQLADLGDVQEQWQIEYDAQGNWVRQIGTMQGQIFITVTRRITY
ncbi:hypothetical protein [Deinococcus sp. PEB2-63]